MIYPVPHIGAMAAYELASLEPAKGTRLISLSQNESLRGPSPLVAQAVVASAEVPQLYPDPGWTNLREEIANVHGVDAGLVLCGNGSLDLIGVLARAYLDPSCAALIPAHAYPFFRTATQMTGARVDIAPEANLTVDPDAILAHATPETRIVFLANPGNPTGTRISREAILHLREKLSGNTLLVVDEAYGEFADHLNEPVFDLVESGDTVVLRTFSKAYGLAGLRVGWGLFPPKISGELRKLLNPNNVAVAGQMAACAALQDQPYMRETCVQTAALRSRFSTCLRGLGLEVPESFTNFSLVRFPTPELAADAARMLHEHGIILRPQGGAGLPECLRATIGAAQDMSFVAELLEIWASQKGGL